MMGAGLVKAAYALAAERRFQDHKAMRLLAYMAATARDDDPQPRFFEGPDALARALASDERSARRSLQVLKGAGFVDATAAHTGKRATYRLRNGNGGALRPETERGGSNEPASRAKEAGRTWSRGGSNLVKEAGRLDPPKEKEEEEEEARASAPARTCRRHETWDHSEPCSACGRDRRAAEAHDAQRRPSTMSPAPAQCTPGSHVFDPGSGYCARCSTRDDEEKAA